MFMKVKKLLCILSVTTLLIGSYTLPSFATPSSTTNWLGLDITQKGPINWTDQQKKIFLDDIYKNTKFSKKYGKIDVSSATNADLEDYGIPGRPTDSQALKQWNEIYGKVKEVIKPEYSIGDSTTCGFSWPSGIVSTEPNCRYWSGVINGDYGLAENKYNSNGYQNVIGMFTVPDLLAMKEKAPLPYQVAFWAGFGNSQNLIQAGVIAYNANGNLDFDPFFELISTDPNNHYYQAPPVRIDNFTMHPNDYVSVGITLQNSGSPAVIKIFDQTTGQMVNQSSQTLGCVDNSCVEWITEHPHTNTPWNLANYGIENWQGSYSYGQAGNNTPQSACLKGPGINTYCEGYTMTNATGGIKSKVSDTPTGYNTFYTQFIASN